MNINILDETTLARIGTVDIYESFIWNIAYNSVGSFELHCPMRYFDLLQTGRIVECTIDDYHHGVIEYITKTTDKDGVEGLQVKGRMLDVILEQRISETNVYEAQQPALILADSINKNAINPPDPNRKIDRLAIGNTPASSYGVVSHTTGTQSILNDALSLCQEARLGFRTYVTEDRRMIFDIYKGENRTEEDNTETHIETMPVQDLLQNGQLTSLSGWTVQNNQRGQRWNGSDFVYFGNYPMVSSGGMISKSKVYDDNKGIPGWTADPIVWNTSPHMYQDVYLVADHIYYAAISVDNQTESVVSFGLEIDGSYTFNVSNTVEQTEYNTLVVPPESGQYRFFMGKGDLEKKANLYVYMDYCVLIDLTATFGAGNEPTLDFAINNIFYSGGWKYKREIVSFIPNANDPLVFSRSWEVLDEVEYTKNIINERNVVYVKGDGLDVVIDSGAAGLKRKEMRLDLSGSVKREVNGIVIPEQSYLAMLRREGNAALRKMVVSELIDGKYYLLSNRKYRQDFYLGDLVNCVDKIGFEVSLRISSTTEVWDTGGYQLTIKFGDDMPDIYETIRLVEKGAK